MSTSILRAATVALIPSVVFLGSGSAYSQTEEVIVTGVLSEAVITDTAASVDVLNREAIAALNKKQLSDVLKTISGVSVEEQGGAGGLVNVYLRGGESNFTLVLVDGIPLNDPTNTRGGSFDFSGLSLESVERIEIVRGPQSTKYGSDALSGVINIITTSGLSGHHQYASLDVGEYGYLRSGLKASGNFEDWGYGLTLSSSDSGEPVKGSLRESDEANFSLRWSPAEQHQLKLAYRYVDGDRSSFPEQSGGPLLALSDQLEESSYRDTSWAAEWEYQVLNGWRSTVSASEYQREEDFVSPGILPYTSVPPNAAETDFTRNIVRWVNRIGGDQYWLHLGADQKREKGTSDGVVDFGFLIPTYFKLDRTTTGVFLDLNGRPTESLLLQASVRDDDPDDMASEQSYNVGIKQQVTGMLSVSANWGQAFKLPSFFALGHSLTGNPMLVPETAESWDLTSEWQYQDHSLRLTYFDNHFEELITFDDASFMNVNSLPVDTSGAEVHWTWQPSTLPVSVQSGVTYTDIDATDSSLKLTGRPEWKAGVSFIWKFAPVWSATVDYQYTGAQYASSQHTGTGTVDVLAGYQLLDLSVAWKVTPQVTLTSALDNSLDEDYENAVGFPGTGRTVRVGVSISL